MLGMSRFWSVVFVLFVLGSAAGGIWVKVDSNHKAYRGAAQLPLPVGTVLWRNDSGPFALSVVLRAPLIAPGKAEVVDVVEYHSDMGLRPSESVNNTLGSKTQQDRAITASYSPSSGKWSFVTWRFPLAGNYIFKDGSTVYWEESQELPIELRQLP